MFEEVEDELDVTFHFTNPGEHGPYIEGHNRVLKERCRVIYHELPYRNIPKIMIKHLALDETRKMNPFPAKGGVSKYYSPKMIIKQTNVDYNKHIKIGFASYVQANQENNPSDTQEA